MKKFFMIFLLLFTLGMQQSFCSNAISEFNKRLSHISNFHACISQDVVDKSGKHKQHNLGELWIKSPSFLKCHLNTPNKIDVFTNGKTVWLSSLDTKQVIIKNIDLFKNKEFSLKSLNEKLWSKFNITQNKDEFTFVPKDKNELHSFKLVLTNDGLIKKIEIMNKNSKKVSSFEMTKISVAKLDENMFKFVSPSKFLVFDQRK